MATTIHRPAWPARAPEPDVVYAEPDVVYAEPDVVYAEPDVVYAEPDGRPSERFLVRVPEPVRLPGFRTVRKGHYPLVGRRADGAALVRVATFGWWGPGCVRPPKADVPGTIVLERGQFDAVVEAGAPAPTSAEEQGLFDLLSD